MKKRSICILTVLAVLLLSACAPGGNFRYNKPDIIADATPPYIEGTYQTELTSEEFKQLSGLDTEGLVNADAERRVEYDGEGMIVNMTYRANNRRAIVYMALHSRGDWSPYSYSPVSLGYGGRRKETTVEGIPMILAYCKGEKFGFSTDMYLAEFALNGMRINIEMDTNDAEEFETFIKKLAEINK